MKRSILMAAGLIGVSGALVAGCGGSSGSGSASTGASEAPAGAAVGSGATFPSTAYLQWCQESGTCSYIAKGSGAGIKDLTVSTVQWAGSDAPLTTDETAAVTGTVLYFPALLGAVTVPTNVTGVSKPLNLTGQAIGDIYAGTVTAWDDAAIASANPGVSLPSAPITVCARADSSGTSYNFSTYLAAASKTFAATVGVGKTPQWGAKSVLRSPGNPGVASCVKGNDNSIGYVDLSDARAAGIADKAAAVGMDGVFVLPTTASISAAGAVTSVPKNLVVDVTGSTAKGAYPITAVTYVLAVTGRDNAATKKAFTYFLGAKAQGQLAGMGFAPLPAALATASTAQLSQLK